MKLANSNLKSKLSLLAVACALAAFTARAQDHLGFYRPLTLAPAEAATAGRGGADDEKAQEAEMAKKLQNAIASLISVPFQNNFDFGAGPTGNSFQQT
ncbi:MAG: hypothetical protein WCT12_05910 [Verrucomicrobiota bacterium]|jgi:hypothetical protein